MRHVANHQQYCSLYQHAGYGLQKQTHKYVESHSQARRSYPKSFILHLNEDEKKLRSTFKQRVLKHEEGEKNDALQQ